MAQLTNPRLTPKERSSIYAIAGGVGKIARLSEAARVLVDNEGDWRARPGSAHTDIDAMLPVRTIILSWMGEKLSQRRGTYSIARRQLSEQDQMVLAEVL